MSKLAVAASLGNLLPSVAFKHLEELSELHAAGRYLSGARWRCRYLRGISDAAQFGFND
jgi:hypothetical protein